MQGKLVFRIIVPKQSEDKSVFAFMAKASDVQKFAQVERVSRDHAGILSGFQRPQITNHIREIKRYLETPTAILPNPIVVGFADSAKIQLDGDGAGLIEIDVSKGPKGWIVDGQQRFTALLDLPEKEFDLFVTGFICSNLNELKKQFILINNTRPLPKTLIYELLPGINGLPERMSNRATAARLVELLNYREDSSLKFLIKQQTNAGGIISDVAIQKVILNSLSDGVLHRLIGEEDFIEKSFLIISNFYQAVQNIFPNAWIGHTPKTSRLVHGAGIVSLGSVMEVLCHVMNAREVDEFESGLSLISDLTAWTEGAWKFNSRDERLWNSIQNINSDIRHLSEFLVNTLLKLIKSRDA